MKIYDISQEVFGCAVYPGDPAPERRVLMKKSEGAVCNLTAFGMCAHNGTHIDAPFHFIDDGKKTDEIGLERFIGRAYVTWHEGELTASDAKGILEKAAKADRAAGEDGDPAYRRILVGGRAVVTEEAAGVFADSGIYLFGNESQTVGPENAPMAVHMIMLRAEIVLLEGIRLNNVPEGIYLLNAAPLNLGGADGAPCRAVLLARGGLRAASC